MTSAVYLTFDDGPHAVHTPEVLDVLNLYGAHATFFQVGECIAAHPELTRRAVREATWSGITPGAILISHSSSGRSSTRRSAGRTGC